MSAIESVGSFTMPPLTGTLDGLWDVILDLADNLPPMSWELVGGQMVMAHGLAAGRTPTRASQDIDVLGNLITSSKALRTAVAAVRELGFEPEPTMDGKRLHRFIRSKDNQAIDILAPDHSPPGWKTTTVPPLQTIRIAGRNQALQRLRVIAVTKGDRTTDVPVPRVLGSLILKAAAYQVDSRDRDRHAADAAFLVWLISDPLELVEDQVEHAQHRRQVAGLLEPHATYRAFGPAGPLRHRRLRHEVCVGDLPGGQATDGAQRKGHRGGSGSATGGRTGRAARCHPRTRSVGRPDMSMSWRVLPLRMTHGLEANGSRCPSVARPLRTHMGRVCPDKGDPKASLWLGPRTYGCSSKSSVNVPEPTFSAASAVGWVSASPLAAMESSPDFAACVRARSIISITGHVTSRKQNHHM